MKKRIIFAIGVVLVLIAILVIQAPERYHIPFETDNIDCVSFYSSNNKEKKVVTLPTDISSICECLGDIYLWGEYNRNYVEDGGQSFVLEFCLTNEETWVFTYFQPNKNSGYFTDGKIKAKVSNFDLKSLWISLNYPIVNVQPEDDGVAFPSLF